MTRTVRQGLTKLRSLGMLWALTPGCGGTAVPNRSVLDQPISPSGSHGCVERGPVAPAELAADTVLHYGVGHRDGSVSFVVKADGTAELATTPAGAEAPTRGTVTPDELEALAKTFRDGDCCARRSCRSEGVPDEARPGISLRLAGLDCAIQLWDGDYSSDPGMQQCLRAVESLYVRVRESAKAQ